MTQLCLPDLIRYVQQDVERIQRNDAAIITVVEDMRAKAKEWRTRAETAERELEALRCERKRQEQSGA